LTLIQTDLFKGGEQKNRVQRNWLWAAPKGGGIEKYQISSTKLQTNLKFQYSMTKTKKRFGPPQADWSL
jgi:hypothetical protein